MTIMDKEKNVKVIESFVGRQSNYFNSKIGLSRKLADVIQSNNTDHNKSHATVLTLKAIKEFLDDPYIKTFDDIKKNQYCRFSPLDEHGFITFRIRMYDEGSIKLFERFMDYVNRIPDIDLMPNNAKNVSTMLRIIVSTYTSKHLVLVKEEEPKDTQPQKYIPIEVKNIIKNLRTCTKCSGLYLNTNSAQVKILLLKSIREILQDSINNIDKLMNRIGKTMDLLDKK